MYGKVSAILGKIQNSFQILSFSTGSMFFKFGNSENYFQFSKGLKCTFPVWGILAFTFLDQNLSKKSLRFSCLSSPSFFLTR